MQVSGFHSGVPVLPPDNCGTPGKLLDLSVASSFLICKMGDKSTFSELLWDFNKHVLISSKAPGIMHEKC